MVARPSTGGSWHNVDPAIVEHFGQDWARFSQRDGWNTDRLREVFESYFEPLPPGVLNSDAIACDFGAGSGRWAMFVAGMVRHLYVLEPSAVALEVAKENLAGQRNVTFIDEPIGGRSTPTGELDLAYALGVLHYVPDPERALVDIQASLKPGGYFLGYAYYALDDRPGWYRTIWRLADRARRTITEMPHRPKRLVTDGIAAIVYWPLARLARVATALGMSASKIPLSQYADKNFYVMRNDAMGRFGARFEHRFSRSAIIDLVTRAGFDPTTLVFSEHDPHWRFCVRNVEAPINTPSATSER